MLDGRSREEGELLPPPPLAPDSPFESPHGKFLRLRRATPRELTWLNLPSKVSRRCRFFFRSSEPRKRRATRTGTFPPHATCGGPHQKAEMHRQHGRTFSAWTGHSSGSTITDDGSDIHITITKAKQRARQSANHREMREKKFLRREPRGAEVPAPHCFGFPLPQTADSAQLITGELN